VRCEWQDGDNLHGEGANMTEAFLELAAIAITALIGLSSACIVCCSFEVTAERKQIRQGSRRVHRNYPPTY
jgi:phage terminase large subunit-like protein